MYYIWTRNRHGEGFVKKSVGSSFLHRSDFFPLSLRSGDPTPLTTCNSFINRIPYSRCISWRAQAVVHPRLIMHNTKRRQFCSKKCPVIFLVDVSTEVGCRTLFPENWIEALCEIAGPKSSAIEKNIYESNVTISPIVGNITAVKIFFTHIDMQFLYY